LHERCSFNCHGNCLNTECQDDTGYCIQCKPGFYGFQCQHNCSLCENERCDLRICSSGCTTGYYEYKTGIDTMCQNCPTNCKHCKDGKTCYICNNGFYLYKFYGNVYCVQCPDCVIQGCNQCQIHNGSLVCADCPEGQIFNGETCGSHTLLCKGNFYSTNCSLACNPACMVTSGKHTCQHADGYCLNGCKQAFWGNTCDNLVLADVKILSVIETSVHVQMDVRMG
jgi:hypothetical protein